MSELKESEIDKDSDPDVMSVSHFYIKTPNADYYFPTRETGSLQRSHFIITFFIGRLELSLKRPENFVIIDFRFSDAYRKLLILRKNKKYEEADQFRKEIEATYPGMTLTAVRRPNGVGKPFTYRPCLR